MLFETLTIKDVKIQIAELTRLLRHNKGLTQEELANSLAVSRLTIRNMEQGKNVTIDTLLKVLQYFDAMDQFHAFITERINDNNVKSLY